ncbi:MAG: hypothetical protein FWE65_02365 [Eggerthellaceae bacterium]|nr:hypothetical protein [Eggerthellaceae bacterium]
MMQSVLVDTSVWSEHFRAAQPLLENLLNDGLVASHELVVEELALSMAAKHLFMLEDIVDMGLLPTASLEEYLNFVSSFEIAGRRIGCVDVHLLASCRLAHAGLWTLDKHLAAAASECGVSILN